MQKIFMHSRYCVHRQCGLSHKLRTGSAGSNGDDYTRRGTGGTDRNATRGGGRNATRGGGRKATRNDGNACRPRRCPESIQIVVSG